MLTGIILQSKTIPFVIINLGVAFEQGKFLPTPETVPFRLTRDMVDGMGLTGVEGVYRRCCEKTMEVMRTSQESLMTVVEVSSLISGLQLFTLINFEGQNTSKLHIDIGREPFGTASWWWFMYLVINSKDICLLTRSLTSYFVKIVSRLRFVFLNNVCLLFSLQ